MWWATIPPHSSAQPTGRGGQGGMYILSSTNTLFCCITTLQCEQTREMLQVGIETRLTLRQSDILPRTIVLLSVSEGILRIYLFTYTLIGVLDS